MSEVQGWELANRDALSRKASFIGKYFSSHQNSIIADLFPFGRNHNIARHEVVVLHNNSLTLSNCGHIGLLLCDFLDLHVAAVKQHVVDSGGQDRESEIDARVKYQLFEDEDDADDVLEEEERFG